MLIKSSIVALLMVFSISLFGQTNEEKKMQEVFGVEWLQKNKASNPGMIKLFSNYLKKGIQIEEMNVKYQDVEELSVIPLRAKGEKKEVSVGEFLVDYNSDDFNALKYAFFPSDQVRIYRLQGVNKILIIANQQTLLN